MRSLAMLLALIFGSVGCLGPTMSGPSSDQKVVVDSEDGSRFEMASDKITEAEIGIPFYPNSKETPLTLRIESPQRRMLTSCRTTEDSLGDVQRFYSLVLEPTKIVNRGSTFANWSEGTVEYSVEILSERGTVYIFLSLDERIPSSTESFDGIRQ